MLEQVVAVGVEQRGFDVVVQVFEQEVFSDLFDRELDGVADQQLINIGDGEVFDGVLSFGNTEVIGSLLSVIQPLQAHGDVQGDAAMPDTSRVTGP